MAAARLKYKILSVSSEDPEYPATELLEHSQRTKGWQTARFCDFPQEMILMFDTPVHLRKVEFLSHQSKIATKIELFTGLAPEGQECRLGALTFKRLGYLSLDSNERSEFQARELKSVYVDVTAQCLKLLFHKNHVNRFNIVNQVGLIALNCLGEGLGPDLAVGQPQPNPALVRGPTQVPSAPSKPARAAVADNGHEAAQAAADEMRYDGKTMERIRALTLAKQRAVEAEDYEEAKRCKEMLVRLRETGLMLRQLEDRKQAAVANEDYDAAKAIKAEIERVRMCIERPQAHPQEAAAPARSTPSPQPSRGQQCRSPQSDYGQQDWGPPAPQARGAFQQRSEQQSPHGADSGRGAPPQPRGGPPQRQASDHLFGPPPGAADTPPPFVEMPPREAMQSPPLPANAGGGAGSRVVHTPVGHAPSGPGGNQPWNGDDDDEPSEQREPMDPNKHPLGGVPNFEDLPQPEAISAASKDDADAMMSLLNEYLVRCLCSKTWNLRDAALQKVVLELNAGKFAREKPSRLLQVLALVLKRCIPDKNQSVALACGPLLQAMTHGILAGGRLTTQEVHVELEPIMPLLAERLGDGTARLDKMSRDAHADFAKCPVVGAPFAAKYVLKPPAKKTVPPRVFSSRLQLLSGIVNEFGIQPESPTGLPLDPTMKLAMACFNNKDGDVRNGAVKLVGGCYSLVGLERIEPYFEKPYLDRPAQRQIFDAEFDRISGGGGQGHDAVASPSGGSGWGGNMPAPQVPPPRGGGGGGGAAQDAAAISEVSACTFCKQQNSTLLPETLDVHYWQECPMLIVCDLCHQVVEIATLFDHLQEECASGAEAQARARSMKPGHCPLCSVVVGAGADEDWWEHLLTSGCAKNPRDQFRRFSHHGAHRG